MTVIRFTFRGVTVSLCGVVVHDTSALCGRNGAFLLFSIASRGIEPANDCGGFSGGVQGPSGSGSREYGRGSGTGNGGGVSGMSSGVWHSCTIGHDLELVSLVVGVAGLTPVHCFTRSRTAQNDRPTDILSAVKHAHLLAFRTTNGRARGGVCRCGLS